MGGLGNIRGGALKTNVFRFSILFSTVPERDVTQLELSSSWLTIILFDGIFAIHIGRPHLFLRLSLKSTLLRFNCLVC